ncbi:MULTISPECIES: S24 family peptidase [Pantoea]|uniref:Helix-turn-helix transcriptional regulator n=1 Tax=Candidatus Pantoea gossypiicola TaxID=2608008 RepID=A0AB34CRU4_9GAMM|nr:MULTISPECIES: S24 family peptidase [Pantoea]KAA5961041.1 helix-turn-helix transcriptional regulator [Pantoea sp. VH_24]KAA5964418.1 helix-turn-helix transcriptional regulator [Pantoea sp. VH_16]KAA5968644.1 helix-turn-helix transcriptional regulator [Pantoea sp. VH_18]KAA6004289.1 helix-turn-helix transcriptional regulator [Pantoea sp. M_1]KAA6006773.1 helix-turn-helix transcriptional regulator [Pantoea sp. F_7]
MNIGNKIRALRISRGLKISDLAVAVGVDSANISRLETGKQKSFTEQSLNKIAKALSIDVSELFTGTPDENTVYNNSTEPSRREGAMMYRVDVLDVSASAGPGSFNVSDVVDVIHSIEYDNTHASTLFGGRPASSVRMINVRGDSMSGTIEPGDLIFVDISIHNFDGDGIYVFGFDEKIHVKRLQMVPDKILVLSDNVNYKEWCIDKSNESRFYVYGKVMISQSQAFKRHG